MFSLSDHDRIRQIVTDAGFDHVDVEEMQVTWTFDDFEAFWTFVTELAGRIAALLEDLDDAERVEIREDTRRALESFRASDGYELPGLTINVLAQ